MRLVWAFVATCPVASVEAKRPIVITTPKGLGPPRSEKQRSSFDQLREMITSSTAAFGSLLLAKFSEDVEKRSGTLTTGELGPNELCILLSSGSNENDEDLLEHRNAEAWCKNYFFVTRIFIEKIDRKFGYQEEKSTLAVSVLRLLGVLNLEHMVFRNTSVTLPRGVFFMESDRLVRETSSARAWKITPGWLARERWKRAPRFLTSQVRSITSRMNRAVR